MHKQLIHSPWCENSARNQVTDQIQVIRFYPAARVAAVVAVCHMLPISLHLSFSHSLYFISSFPLPPSLRSFSAVLRASTHIKWRAAVRFQFRTHLWCCRPPTRSAVAEGTQGSPITALYANVLAPGQQRGHAGTRSLFMQISGRQSQHNTEPATDTGGHISPPAQKKEIVQKTWKMWTEWQEEDWSDKVKEIKKYMELMVNKMHEWYR